MHRQGGLRTRLLAAIGILAVLFLAVLLALLLSIRQMRHVDNEARRSASVVIPASRLQVELSRLESAQRGLVSAAPSQRATYVQSVEHALRSLRARSRDLEPPGAADTSLADAARREAARIERYVEDLTLPLLDKARSGASLARERRAATVDDRRAEAIVTRLGRLVERGRHDLLARRARTGVLAHRAEIIGAVGFAATLLFVLGCIMYMRRAVLGPLGRVADAARALAAGDLRARVRDEHGGAGEVADLAETFDRMAASLEESRGALERQNAELESQSAELVDAVRSAREGASVLRAVLDATPDAIALLDGAGGVLVDNPPMRAVRAAFGARATAIDRHGALVPLDAQPTDAETRDEITLLGTRRAFARYAAPVRDTHGRVVGRLLVLREITGEREAERVKEEFFALVSHELRTPLTAILGYVELVLGEDEDAVAEEQRRYLEIVERNAQRLLRLVGDLLFAAQVESGTLLLDPGTVDLPQITREAVEAARPRAEDAGIALEARIDRVAPSLGDRDRLAQVLDNLISNALKFTPAGGRVEVRLSTSGGDAVLSVSDTGAGIPLEEQARLFDRFFRASNATARAVPGVGLGLMIVRAIVSAHGGTIGVESAVGSGTTFTARLPLRAPREGRAEEPVAYRTQPPLRRYSAGGR